MTINGTPPPEGLSVREMLDLIMDAQMDIETELAEIKRQLAGPRPLRDVLEETLATLNTLVIWAKRRSTRT